MRNITYNNMVNGETSNARDETSELSHSYFSLDNVSQITGGLTIEKKKFEVYEFLKFILSEMEDKRIAKPLRYEVIVKMFGRRI